MKRAFTLAEALIGIGLFALLIGVVMGVQRWTGFATARLTPQLALQQQSRKALVGMLTELQESMEVVSPKPGCTLSYALVRDRLSLTRWYYQLPAADGRSTQLWRYVDDPELDRARRATLLLSGIRRLTFTARTEGALQLNLVLGEGDQELALLTTVRLRNVAAAEEIW